MKLTYKQKLEVLEVIEHVKEVITKKLDYALCELEQQELGKGEDYYSVLMHIIDSYLVGFADSIFNKSWKPKIGVPITVKEALDIAHSIRERAEESRDLAFEELRNKLETKYTGTKKYHTIEGKPYIFVNGNVRRVDDMLYYANLIAKEARETDPDVKEILWFPDYKELRIVIIDPSAATEKEEYVMPFYFPATEDIPVVLAIACILPNQRGKLLLHDKWGEWEDAREI